MACGAKRDIAISPITYESDRPTGRPSVRPDRDRSKDSPHQQCFEPDHPNGGGRRCQGRHRATYSFSTVVLTSTSVTEYGSQLDDGRRSSRYPLPFSATSRGMRMLEPRLATPAEKSCMEDVSWCPVSRRSLSLPSCGSYAFMCRAWCVDSFSMASSISLKADVHCWPCSRECRNDHN